MARAPRYAAMLLATMAHGQLYEAGRNPQFWWRVALQSTSGPATRSWIRRPAATRSLDRSRTTQLAWFSQTVGSRPPPSRDVAKKHVPCRRDTTAKQGLPNAQPDTADSRRDR